MNNKALVLILGLAGFVSAADNWFVSPSLSAVAAGFGVSAAAAGIILTAYMIPYGLMQPMYGFFSDRWNKAKLLRIIVFGLAVGTAGSSLSGSLTILCIWRIITGFFAAGIIAVSISFIGDVIPASEQQIYVGKFMGIVFTGQGLSSGLGGIITKYISWRGAFVFFAFMAVCAALLLKKLTDASDEGYTNNKGFFHELRQVLFSPKGKIIFPMAFFTGFLLLGVYGYLGSFLHERIHLDYMQSGIVIMFYGFACLTAGSKVGQMAKRSGRKKIIICGEILAVTAIILLILCYIFKYWQIALIATIFLGSGYIFIQSSLATIALDVTEGCKGLPSGLIGLGLFCGGGLGSMAGSILLAYGTYLTIWISFGTMILISVFAAAKLKLE